jgi:hypothetical protein
MERPDVLDGEGVGKHRAIAVKLKLIVRRDNDECGGPTHASSNDQPPQGASIEAG